MFSQYTHQNTYMCNLKPCLWSVRCFRCVVSFYSPKVLFLISATGLVHLGTYEGLGYEVPNYFWGYICEKVPLNPFYLLCYLKTICPHSPMSPAGPFLPLLPRIESGGARHRLLKKKPSGQRKRWGGLLRVEGVMLGNQNDRQQWKVFCGLPHICEVGWLVSFHSSLWSSGKHWLSHGVSLSVVRLFLLHTPVRWLSNNCMSVLHNRWTETRWHDCFL